MRLLIRCILLVLVLALPIHGRDAAAQNYGASQTLAPVASGEVMHAFSSVRAETPLSKTQEFARIDFVVAGAGGMGASGALNGGTGALSLSGVSGDVVLALLYWNGIDWESAADGFVGGNGDYDQAEIVFDGNTITGTRIASMGNNDCWGTPPNDHSAGTFRADVTALVQARGNGEYGFSGLADGAGHSANGMSLIVYFNDGNAANDLHVDQYEGSLSSEESQWDLTFPLDYLGGPVEAVLHVSDGQVVFSDGRLRFTTIPGIPNSTATSISYLNNLPDGLAMWAGLSVPLMGHPRNSSATGLWDIRRAPLTSMYGPRRLYTTSMSITSGPDCVSLHIVQIVRSSDQQALSLVPNPFDFGDVLELTPSPPQVFTLTNHLGVPITISVPTVSPTAWFAIVADSCSGQTLAASATCQISVTCTPRAFGSVLASGSLRIPWNGHPLDGTHYAQLDCASVPAGAFARLEFEPVRCNFGDVAISTTTSPRSFIARSSGNLPLTLTTIYAPANGFSITDSSCTPGLNMPPGTSCQLDVIFQAPAIAATRSSEVSIDYAASNDASEIRDLALSARSVTSLPTMDPGDFKNGFEHVPPRCTD